jgi:hypothetical protein
MWRDNRLQGNDYFSDSIEEQLLDVAVLLSVISPGYRESKWCQRELKGFLAAVEKSGGLRRGTQSRLFKILKTPTDRHAQPDSLKELLGYEFYHEGREFHLNPDPTAEKRYLAKLDDLAKDIHLVLKQLNPTSPAAPPSPMLDGNKRVYLAWTTSDLNESRDDIRRELIDRGYTVLPEASPPLVADSLMATVRQALKQCCISVHPIGSTFGIVPEGASRSLAWLQHELATERYKVGQFSRLVWLPPGIEAKEHAQTEFLSYLEKEIGGLNNCFQFLRTPVEELKTILLKQLSEPIRQASAAMRAEATLRIYLVCERGDRAAVRPIENFLKSQHWNVELPLLSGNLEEIVSDHRETLIDCDAVLIYHGNGSEGWLREKTRDCRRASAWGRTKKFVAQAIYIGPEPNDAKNEYQNDEFNVSRNFGPFSPPAIEPFLAAIRASAGATA